LTFFKLHGPSLVEYRSRREDPLKKFFEDLVKQPWYWEDKRLYKTSDHLIEEAKKNKNSFLIGDGNEETYTLDVCLGINCFVQNISLKDISSCRNYAKQLTKSGYTFLKKTDYAMTKEDFSSLE